MEPRIAYRDGHFVPEEQVHVALCDAGFVWGATVSDRVRTYGRRYFRLGEHLVRFRRSCELCRIPQLVPDAELTLFAQHLLQENGSLIHPNFEVTLVLLATPGDHNHDRSLCLYTEPCDMERFRPLLERGARLVTPPTRHVPNDCIPRQAKMRSRMHWWIAEQEARELDPDAHALLLDHDGTVTETAMANFLIVRDGALISPPRAAILDGISLRVVEELCHEMGIPFVEQPLTPAECEQAEEALLTSTPFGIAGVSSLNGRPIPWPGPMLRRLASAWSAEIGQPLHAGLASPAA